MHYRPHTASHRQPRSRRSGRTASTLAFPRKLVERPARSRRSDRTASTVRVSAETPSPSGRRRGIPNSSLLDTRALRDAVHSHGHVSAETPAGTTSEATPAVRHNAVVEHPDRAAFPRKDRRTDRGSLIPNSSLLDISRQPPHSVSAETPPVGTSSLNHRFVATQFSSTPTLAAFPRKPRARPTRAA